ncbi:hypothetical protein [Tsukamurella pseudospumae]|uniref:Uncharacterized protein n=1 Tax=Tsukamurella pseudospumae TaxID=239498 RepID=A0A138AIH8_9ACTN|nr:hypothetical protein [Tsukamurella pseudospumae]KXP00025.1 hypothetical protein AXK61_15585 [Tsukamurella pseudospumae]KXP10286.1 hypothetical protein AXK60_07410 [Tsukamurella pseudospumae]
MESELPEPPRIDRYAEFVMSMPEESRRRLGRLLENLATRDEGGWLIVNQTADDFLRRHREYLRSIVDNDYPDAFDAGE